MHSVSSLQRQWRHTWKLSCKLLWAYGHAYREALYRAESRASSKGRTQSLVFWNRPLSKLVPWGFISLSVHARLQILDISVLSTFIQKVRYYLSCVSDCPPLRYRGKSKAGKRSRLMILISDLLFFFSSQYVLYVPISVCMGEQQSRIASLLRGMIGQNLLFYLQSSDRTSL